MSTTYTHRRRACCARSHSESCPTPRFGHRSQRIGLLGLEANADLRRVVGQNLDIARIPPEGVLLTSKLAQGLGVRPGENITVEILEGERPVRQVAVSATVDEMIGLSAYMDISGLNRLLHEGPSILGASLSVDAEKLGALYSQLKRTPAVAGVAVRQAIIESFYPHSESLRISTAATESVCFRNRHRHGLQWRASCALQRGHELASLRVLGFSQREISFMLLGERHPCVRSIRWNAH